MRRLGARLNLPGIARNSPDDNLSSPLRAWRSIMDGKVIVVTGALGALGKVVVETALARGGRVAAVAHAPTQLPTTPPRLELGGVDLTDAAQARKAIEAAMSHFGKLDAL